MAILGCGLARNINSGGQLQAAGGQEQRRFNFIVALIKRLRRAPRWGLHYQYRPGTAVPVPVPVPVQQLNPQLASKHLAQVTRWERLWSCGRSGDASYDYAISYRTTGIHSKVWILQYIVRVLQ